MKGFYFCETKCQLCRQTVFAEVGNLRDLCKKEHPEWFLDVDVERIHVVDYADWEATKKAELEQDIPTTLCFSISSPGSHWVFAACPRHMVEIVEELVDKAYSHEATTNQPVNPTNQPVWWD